MFGFMKKLIFSKQLSFKKGSFALLGHPVMLAPVQLFSGMVEQFHKEGNTGILYDIAWTAGRDYGKTVKKRQNFKASEMFDWGLKTVTIAGLGIAESEKLDMENKEAMIRVRESAVAKDLAPTDFKVDYAIAGYIGGYCSVMFDSENIKCEETQCLAAGADSCIFRIEEQD